MFLPLLLKYLHALSFISFLSCFAARLPVIRKIQKHIEIVKLDKKCCDTVYDVIKVTHIEYCFKKNLKTAELVEQMRKKPPLVACKNH